MEKEAIGHYLFSKTNQVITTISGIGNIYRFDSPSKLVAFAGLDIKVNQYGEFFSTKNKISKRGSRYLPCYLACCNKSCFL